MRHRNWRPSASALAGLGLVACTLFLLLQQQVVGGEGAAGVGEEDRAPASEGLERDAKDEPSREASPQGGDSSGQLALVLRWSGGEAAEGTVSWRFSEQAPQLGDLLSPASPLASSAADAPSRIEHAGNARLIVPAGQFTWLAATARGTGAHGQELARRRYALVPPFEGHESLELVFDRERFGLHVFVLAEDWQGAASRQEVRLLSSGPDGAGPRTLETNADGYVYFEGLEEGVYGLLAPGANARARPPHARSLTFTRGFAPAEAVVTLVAQEAMQKLALHVLATFDPKVFPPPILYLEGAGDSLGRIVPLAARLRPGAQDLEAEAPAGSYVLRCLPTDRFGLRCEPERLELGAGQPSRAKVELLERPRRTRLVLEGLGDHHLPLMVELHPLARPRASRMGLLAAGSYHWRSLSAEVGMLPEPVIVAATGRRGSFLSAEPQRLAAGETKVAMRPARMLVVEWEPREAWVLRGSLLAIEAGLRTDLVLLERRLPRVDGRSVLRLCASTVIPRGPVRVRALGPTGKEHWSRLVAAGEEPRVVVEVAR